MAKVKSVLLLVGASVAAGCLLGALYAPADGAETRRRLRRLKQRFSCCHDDSLDDDRASLTELSDLLQKELKKVNEKIEKLG